MVLRDLDTETFDLGYEDGIITVDEEFLARHPGGSAITTYSGMDATTAFHVFHRGSDKAYLMAKLMKKRREPGTPIRPTLKQTEEPSEFDSINIGKFDIDSERVTQINSNFDKLRADVEKRGLMEGSTIFYIRKVLEAICMILTAFYLQYHQQYVFSAILMGVSWQQLGWLVHEFAHHQLFKNRYYNDLASYFVGNFLQGFSSGGWKEQHNMHHAATNVVGKDGDLDLMPFYATVAHDLNNVNQFVLSILTYQHVYWTVMLPLLRLSWLLQSILFVKAMPNHFYNYYRKTAKYEIVGLALHWSYVLIQLYCLPDNLTRVKYFLISQLVGGFLLAHVVTYNHYSVDKFTINSNIMSSYACLQLMTTRNMRPGTFIDWLWGGLNYQIEHHLFPTMPRHNLNTVMPMVKRFAAENDLPYMVDDYMTGYRLKLKQFQNIANIVPDFIQKQSKESQNGHVVESTEIPNTEGNNNNVK